MGKKCVSTDLFQQVPEPVSLAGDFISYHEILGNASQDDGGNKVFNFIQKRQNNLMNDRRYTRKSNTLKCAIVCTIVSPSSQLSLLSNVADCPYDSDSCDVYKYPYQKSRSSIPTHQTQYEQNRLAFFYFERSLKLQPRSPCVPSRFQPEIFTEHSNLQEIRQYKYNKKNTSPNFDEFVCYKS